MAGVYVQCVEGDWREEHVEGIGRYLAARVGDRALILVEEGPPQSLNGFLFVAKQDFDLYLLGCE
jgi:hypothetical protein